MTIKRGRGIAALNYPTGMNLDSWKSAIQKLLASETP